MGTVLFVELGELVKIVEIRTVPCIVCKKTFSRRISVRLTSFNEIDLLTSGSKVKVLNVG